MRKPVFGVFDQVRHKPVLQPQKMVTEKLFNGKLRIKSTNQQKMFRGLKFQVLKVERLYYPGRENRGTDQLDGYYAADLCHCFHNYKSRFSHDTAHIVRS